MENVEAFCAKSPSSARCKEGDLPLLDFSNLTCTQSEAGGGDLVFPICLKSEKYKFGRGRFVLFLLPVKFQEFPFRGFWGVDNVKFIV